MKSVLDRPSCLRALLILQLKYQLSHQSTLYTASWSTIKSALASPSDYDAIGITSDMNWKGEVNVTYDMSISSYTTDETTIEIDGGGDGSSADGATRIFRIVSKATLTLDSIEIIYAGTEGNGAVAYIDTDSSLIMSDCTITSVYAAGSGGSIYCDGCNSIYLYSSDFTSSVAVYNGGALSIASTSGTIEMDSSTFKQSFADQGSALYLASTVVYMLDDIFSSSSASTDVALGPEVTLYSCSSTFTITLYGGSASYESCDWTVKPSNSPAPTTSSPSSLFPTTAQPSLIPTSAIPSLLPTHRTTTTPPTHIPTSSQPSSKPTTLTPTVAPTFVPTSSQPSVTPTTFTPTILPTFIPTSHQPSLAPTTTVPTFMPTSSQPSFTPTTPTPTILPTLIPTSHQPSLAPTTTLPTFIPTSSQPSLTPSVLATTAEPTHIPTSSQPSSVPTNFPTTTQPTHIPTTSQPSLKPSTLTPTTVVEPTLLPSSAQPSMVPSVLLSTPQPTHIPTTSQPTSMSSSFMPTMIVTLIPAGTGMEPTPSPTSSQPTLVPSFSILTLEPTAISTVAPTSPSVISSPTLMPTTTASILGIPTPIPTTFIPSTLYSPGPTISLIPSRKPTPMPTTSHAPSISPTSRPTAVPSLYPSPMPSREPSSSPTLVPTLIPTTLPTASPTPVPQKADDDDAVSLFEQSVNELDWTEGDESEQKGNAGATIFLLSYAMLVLVLGEPVLSLTGEALPENSKRSLIVLSILSNGFNILFMQQLYEESPNDLFLIQILITILATSFSASLVVSMTSTFAVRRLFSFRQRMFASILYWLSFIDTELIPLYPWQIKSKDGFALADGFPSMPSSQVSLFLAVTKDVTNIFVAVATVFRAATFVNLVQLITVFVHLFDFGALIHRRLMNRIVKKNIRSRLRALGQSIHVPGGYRTGEWATTKEVELNEKNRNSIIDQTMIYAHDHHAFPKSKDCAVDNPLARNDTSTCTAGTIDFSVYDESDASSYENPLTAKEAESKSASFAEESVYHATTPDENKTMSSSFVISNPLASERSVQRQESLFLENSVYDLQQESMSTTNCDRATFTSSNPLASHRSMQRQQSLFEENAVYKQQQESISTSASDSATFASSNPLASHELLQRQESLFPEDAVYNHQQETLSKGLSNNDNYDRSILCSNPLGNQGPSQQQQAHSFYEASAGYDYSDSTSACEMSAEQQRYFYGTEAVMADDDDLALDVSGAKEISTEKKEETTINTNNNFFTAVQRAMLEPTSTESMTLNSNTPSPSLDAMSQEQQRYFYGDEDDRNPTSYSKTKMTTI